MSLHTVRFLIALALSIGLTLTAVSQPASPSQDDTCIAVSEPVAGEHSAPAHVLAVNSRPSLSWRSLLPGSFR